MQTVGPLAFTTARIGSRLRTSIGTDGVTNSIRRCVEAHREEMRMLEIGLFHNGASSLPIITNEDGVTFNDGALPEVHRAAQETLVNQVRQGILAEKLGFQSFWLTEHHFQPEGAEMSPNPLMVQMSVAAHTKRIRLGQAANIIVWHHPVRLAEQIALLDVISGGRVECGIGRRRRQQVGCGRPGSWLKQTT